MKKIVKDYKNMIDLFVGCQNDLITEFQWEINYTVKEFISEHTEEELADLITDFQWEINTTVKDFINEHTEEELADLITVLVTNEANNYKVKNMRLNFDNYEFEKL